MASPQRASLQVPLHLTLVVGVTAGRGRYHADDRIDAVIAERKGCAADAAGVEDDVVVGQADDRTETGHNAGAVGADGAVIDAYDCVRVCENSRYRVAAQYRPD